MLKDSSNNYTIDVPTSLLVVVFISLVLLVLGLISFSALGSATFLY